jgi:hypothetical protein
MTDVPTGRGTYAARDEDSEGLLAPLLLDDTLTQVVSGGTYVVLATGTVAASTLHYAVLPRGYDTPSPEAVVTKTATAAVVTGEYSLSLAATTMELGIGGLSPDNTYSVYCVAALGSHVGVAQAYVTALDVQTTVPTAPMPTITVTRGTLTSAAREDPPWWWGTPGTERSRRVLLFRTPCVRGCTPAKTQRPLHRCSGGGVQMTGPTASLM